MSRDRAGDGETGGPGDDKEELRRRMEETREAITGTVGEIKAVVAQQYEEVRGRVEGVREAAGEVLDWHGQFERNPVVWGAGAVSVGILIGLGLARALEDEDGAEPRSESLAGRAAGELTALAEAVLPAISAQVKELFGLDLDAYLRESRRPRPARALDADREAAKNKSALSSGGEQAGAAGGASRKRPAAKKGSGERRASKKRGAAKGADESRARDKAAAPGGPVKRGARKPPA